MSADFRAALAAVMELKRESVVTDYAIGGAMAIVFWTEPVPTFDLAVFILLPETSSLIVSLDPIYRWAESNGFPADSEHIVISGLPVQFIPRTARLLTKRSRRRRRWSTPECRCA